MGTRFEQGAQETLQWHADRAKADWERFKEGQEPLGEPWKPVLTEQEKQAQEKYVRDNDLPF